jgi:glutamine amidotransferase
MWADSNFANMAALLFSDCVVAAVRDASPGMPVDESSTAPFTADHYLFAHNGLIDGFRTGAGTKLRRQLSPERDAGIVGGADSEVAFALVLDRLDAGDALPDAVRSAIAAIRAVTGGRFNFVVSDGAAIVASRAGDSLYVWSAEAPDGPATLVASEPLDDEGDWIAVPDEHLVVATRTTVPDLRPLDP